MICCPASDHSVPSFRISQPNESKTKMKHGPVGNAFRRSPIKDGVPYGQMKPLKMSNPEHSETIDRLREA